MALDIKKDEVKNPEDANISIGILQLQYSEEEEKRVIRKIDSVILPMVGLLFPSNLS